MGAGKPKMLWKKLTKNNCCERKLKTVDPQKRSTWRSGVRSAMHAASQLPGRGPTDVYDAPAHLINLTYLFIYYDMMMLTCSVCWV